MNVNGAVRCRGWGLDNASQCHVVHPAGADCVTAGVVVTGEHSLHAWMGIEKGGSFSLVPHQAETPTRKRLRPVQNGDVAEDDDGIASLVGLF